MCSRDQRVQRGTRDAIVHVGPYVWVGPYVRPVLVAPVSFTVFVPRVRARGRSERREPVCVRERRDGSPSAVYRIS